MDPRFNDIFTSPENEIFRVVFYPDRIYHAQYLNATRSPRYRYNVQEVRSKLDITVIKGEVYLDGVFLSNFLRIEYRSGRIVEMSRQKGRLAGMEMMAWLRLLPENGLSVEAKVKLHLCHWTDSYQVELWETLEPPTTVPHDFSVLDMMGYNAPITRVAAFAPALKALKSLNKMEMAFRENDLDLISGFKIVESDAAWDNNYLSSHQEPRNPAPSSNENTVKDENYLINFQRGWFLQASDVQPVRYENAMMDGDSSERFAGNVTQMRWILQREFGSSVVFFHEVTVLPGVIEGTHRHIGSEELYYITEGQGVAYMGDGDDPATGQYPLVEPPIYGIGKKLCRALPVRPGSVIFTKSGGIHGIRNTGDKPLKFVAFLYHSA